jgi:hypothetical protein
MRIAVAVLVAGVLAILGASAIGLVGLSGSASATWVDATPAGTAPATPAPTAAPTSTPRTTPSPSRTTVPPARVRSKKGVSTWDFSGVGAALTDVRATWYYNWAATPTSGAGTSAEFVPMIWGSGSVKRSTLDKAAAGGGTILGFNEPDFSSQANLSVDDALTLWPQLVATGRRLGSPAVATGGADANGWLDRFMAGARQRSLRVDFITLHWYGSDFSPAAVGQLESYVKAVHARYGLPIWLTEFALIKFTSSGSVYPTSAQQVAFVQGATAMLNSLSYVERYAWFALPTSNGSDATGLYRNATTPTPVGAAYRAVP